MKKNINLVSILIINYNNSKYIDRAVQSCLKQTYKKIEILIFDDKSQDGSKKTILKYKNIKKFKYYFNKKNKKNVAAFDAANGYIFLFKKSKGNIICLLDSDDFFSKNKVHKIVDTFEKNKNINFIQNLPLLLNKKYLKKKNNKNNFLSFWPYLAPESCISFKREFFKSFLKTDYKYKNMFNDVWMGFRFGVFAYYIKKSFFNLNDYLTTYHALGQSGNYQTFNSKWFARRKQSFEYLYKISNKNIIYKINLDYIITSVLSFILNIFKK